MAFDQAIPHTLSGKYTLERPALLKEAFLISSAFIAVNGNKEALTPVSGPQREKSDF